jgi:glycosyltransferase involved in cell wall biosynthesis
MSKKKILIISHDANRVGGPILLLNLAELLTKSGNYEVSFLIKAPPYTIVDRFQKYSCSLASKEKKLISRFFDKLSLRYKVFSVFVSSKYDEQVIKKALQKIDVILSNTITNGDILPIVRKYYSGKLYSYIHELEISSLVFSTEKEVNNVVTLSDGFIAPCDAIKKHLINYYSISEAKIDLLPYYIPPTNLEIEKQSSKNVFNVGAAGTVEWRKGSDLFIQTAILLFSKMPNANIHFYWKGANENIDLIRHRYEVEKAGLTDKITFLPNSGDIEKFYESIDIFILTSREDPYPLVVLEAANYAIPTICFNEAGGSPEFITQFNAGKCVDYINTEQMSNTILGYYNDNKKLKEDGINARNGLKEKHQQLDSIAKTLSNMLFKN